jgi:hypothetical protein
MNTDHINYQQQIIQSMNEDKDHELLENTENAPKEQITSSNPIPTNENYQRNDQNSENHMNILTTIERRERIFTLLVIAFIALLTGKILISFLRKKKRISILRD